MIAVVMVALTVGMFVAVGLYARAKARDQAEHTSGSTLLMRRRVSSKTSEQELLELAARIAFLSGRPISTVLVNLRKAAMDPIGPSRLHPDAVAAEEFRMSSPAVAVKPSRGVDRVPERLKVERTKPLPEPILPGAREVRGRWVSAPYRNPDRLARLAKNGRLRAEHRPG